MSFAKKIRRNLSKRHTKLWEIEIKPQKFLSSRTKSWISTLHAYILTYWANMTLEIKSNRLNFDSCNSLSSRCASQGKKPLRSSHFNLNTSLRERGRTRTTYVRMQYETNDPWVTREPLFGRQHGDCRDHACRKLQSSSHLRFACIRKKFKFRIWISKMFKTGEASQPMIVSMITWFSPRSRLENGVGNSITESRKGIKLVHLISAKLRYKTWGSKIKGRGFLSVIKSLDCLLHFVLWKRVVGWLNEFWMLRVISLFFFVRVKRTKAE